MKVIAFEFLQRPENILADYIRWSDYRGPSAPAVIRIERHETGEQVLHPPEAVIDDESVQFYPEVKPF